MTICSPALDGLLVIKRFACMLRLIAPISAILREMVCVTGYRQKTSNNSIKNYLQVIGGTSSTSTATSGIPKRDR